jgi:hypothetical protein
VVDSVPQGGNGTVLATPRRDHRISLAILLGDWPARLCAVLVLVATIGRLKPKRLKPEPASPAVS